MQWLNEFNRLHEFLEPVLSLAHMYQSLSVILMSHTTARSFDKTLSVVRQSESTVPSVERDRYIAENILAYSRKRKGVGERLH